jgi:hypothetical protein
MDRKSVSKRFGRSAFHAAIDDPDEPVGFQETVDPERTFAKFNLLNCHLTNIL